MPIPRMGGKGKEEAEATTNGGSYGTRGQGQARVHWAPLEVDTSRYVISIIQGADQTGKTHFALTAPAPILVMTFDPANLRGVAKKFAGAKDIQVASFEVPKGLVSTSVLAQAAKAEAGRYHATFIEAAQGETFRTIVMDREDDAWELFRLDEFDGASSAKAHHFVQLNSQYKAMLKLAEKYKKNLVMIDAMKEEYRNNKPTGEMARSGFKTLGMLSQLTLEGQCDAYDNFKMQVVRCRDDATKNGVMLDRQYLSTKLSEATGGWPIDPVTGEADWYHLEWANVMAYLIGGTTDEWR